MKISSDLPFDGVLLIALAGEVPGREMPYVAALPTLAAGAWHYQKIDRAGRTVLNEVLKYPATDPYYGVNFAVNAAWKYDAGENPYEALGHAMRDNPKMRLFWAAGYYDLTTPAYAGRYVLDQVGVPGAQLTAKYFAGPHGVNKGDANLTLFSDAVRAFLQP